MDIYEINLTKGFKSSVDAEDFVWLNQWKWSYNGTAYAIRGKYLGKFDGKPKYKTLWMHREILRRHNLLKENLETDHINRNPLDNRKENLRMVTRRENVINRGLHKKSKSGFKGVVWDGSTTNKYKKWQARIVLNKKFINLGRFLTKEEAALAYNKVAKRYFGKYTYINQIGGKNLGHL